jgi:threonine synthase
MNAVRDTDGAFVAVSDDEILAAIPTMARGVGVFAEPAAAAGYAGLARAAAEGMVGRDDRVLLLSTGSGLKDVPAVMQAVEAAGTEPRRVDPELAAVEQALGEPG